MIASFHSHTHYSILDGAMTVEALVHNSKARGIEAIGITEHGNMFSAVEFFVKAREAGIKPIIGCELYVAPTSMAIRDKDEKNFHITVLCKDETGYKNLCKILTKANFEGFYRKPRTDLKTLAEYSEGLIVLSGCLQGEIPRLILSKKYDVAIKRCEEMKKAFGNNFYLEVMSIKLEEQDIVNEHLFEFSKKLKIPLVASTDCHYVNEEDWEVQDILICIAYNSVIGDKSRFRYRTHDLYIKSSDEMKERFSWAPQSLQIHEDIIRQCKFEFNLGKIRFPARSDFTYNKLEELAIEGLKKRLAGKSKKEEEEYFSRLKNELSVIKQKNFSEYFLIVRDFVNRAKENGIPVGPGRGSAAGSVVAWSLGITSIDPIKYNLIFERFMNPERQKLPDIDVDFCRDRRDEVVDYVSQVYGRDCVSHIITFGTIGARLAIRDAGRVLQMPLTDVSRFAELVPQEPGRRWTLIDAYNEVQEFRNLVETNPNFKKLFEVSLKIEGFVRQYGTHASGFVISDSPLTEFIPLRRGKNEGEVTTEYEMESLEKLGLAKFDFLGLETLTIINKVIQSLKAKGINFDMDNLALDDRKTLEMFSSGDTLGVFQFESMGMRELLKKMEPERFEDLIAAVALYRPGPIQSGMVDQYIRRKKGLESVQYPHPSLESILKETYGIYIYQEQIMSTANIMAGFSMGEADILRESMGKKRRDLMERMRERFITGAKAKGIEEQLANSIFDIMEKFAGYAFNKAHSVAYAYISYVTGYLKAHYPLEFFSALLTSEIKNPDKLSFYIKSLKDAGVRILPPDINKSNYEFEEEGDAIRFGFGGIKGIGDAGKSAIQLLRQKKQGFRDLNDFLSGAKSVGINKKVIESLAKSGAFDSLGVTRSEALAVADKSRGTLFLTKSRETDFDTIAKYEMEVLGVVLSEPEYIKKIRECKEFFPIYVSSTLVQFAGVVVLPLEVQHNGEEIYIFSILQESFFSNRPIEGISSSRFIKKPFGDTPYVIVGRMRGMDRISVSWMRPLDEVSLFLIPNREKNNQEEVIKSLKSNENEGNVKSFILADEKTIDTNIAVKLNSNLRKSLMELDCKFYLG